MTTLAAIPPALTPDNFDQHIRLHRSGVDQISRAWWRLFVGEMLPTMRERQRQLAFDLLAELGRIHDVSKWGTRWRFDSPFRPRFEQLQVKVNEAMGRAGARARTMRQGSDFLFDFIAVDFKAADTPEILRTLGEEIRVLLNEIDAAATDEVLTDWRYADLPPQVKAILLGAVSLADLTHRYRSSLTPEGANWSTATRIEFGRAMLPVDAYLKLVGRQGRQLPGLPEAWAHWYPIDVAGRHGRILSDDEEVQEIVGRTTFWKPLPEASRDCGPHFVEGWSVVGSPLWPAHRRARRP